MQMEVMIPSPSPAVDFNFDSASNSPYATAPSSPHRFGNFFFSAPTSPSSSFRGVGAATSPPSTVPFSWEEKPGTPKSKDGHDFEFNFSGQLEKVSLSAADELFAGGKIKPLKPPPRLQLCENAHTDSPKSPKSPKSPMGSKFLREALSPRRKKKDIDPFEAAIEQTRRENSSNRGRERKCDSTDSSRRKKGEREARSLSPFRVCDIFTESDQSNSSSTSSAKNSAWKGYKWNLKNLWLFRSASEGRADASKDPLKKYSLLRRSGNDDVKNSSFRSTDSAGSVSSRRRGPGGGPGSEEVRRKTFLPYNHGLLGCMGFNPAVHDISRRVGSMTRG